MICSSMNLWTLNQCMLNYIELLPNLATDNNLICNYSYEFRRNMLIKAWIKVDFTDGDFISVMLSGRIIIQL
jgi:hypothetical protein